MHYQLEVVMPPTDDVEAALKQILWPFDENANDDDHDKRHAFYDYWQIGGRWSGNKMLATLGEDRLDAFHKMLHDRRITVSGLRWGKPTLQPTSQVAEVDMLWRRSFPDAPVSVCPLFDNYKGDWGDVMSLKDAPLAMKCSHVIVAALDYKDVTLEAVYMIQESMWNGVTHIKAAWDGTLGAAIEGCMEKFKNYTPEYAAKRTPQPDWLVVTVDYHS
jgi:hypothetical protein